MVYHKRHFVDLFKTAWQSSRHALAPIERWLLPARCIACAGTAELVDSPLQRRSEIDLCAACRLLLPINLHACQRCAQPLPSTTPGLICGACLKRPPSYDVSYCAYEYAYPIEHLIRRLKYGSVLTPARVLSRLLVDYLRDRHEGHWPTCFIPVPLHSSRYRMRGYNQVIEVGRHLERELNITMRTDLVMRNRHTPEQAGLSRRDRRKNLRRAFITTTVALPKHIALLDDVITTGTTVNELANTLKTAGVAHIEIWGLARAPIKAKSKAKNN